MTIYLGNPMVRSNAPAGTGSGTLSADERHTQIPSGGIGGQYSAKGTGVDDLGVAIFLFGTIARSLFPVKTWVARQFISMTRPSVLPSMLIQSPGRYGRLKFNTMPENTSLNVLCSASPRMIAMAPDVASSPLIGRSKT